MLGHMVKCMLLFSLWEPSQHFCMGRAVTFQRLQVKKGAWEEIYQNVLYKEVLS